MVDIRLDVPGDDELAAMMEAAWTLAVAKYGQQPTDDQVEAMFVRLMLDRSNGE